MLMKVASSCLVVIDVQERLLPVIADAERVERRCGALMQAARRLDVPMLVSEQYPKGIGPTVASLRDLAPAGAVAEKMHFSCGEEATFAARLAAIDRCQVVVAGIEAHVCVLQSCLSFKEQGYDVFVVADACSSRDPRNAELAFDRMRGNGIAVVSTEMVLFEWLHRAGTAKFKDLMKLIK